MGKNDLVETTGNVLLDVFSLLGLPTNVANQYFHEYIKKRTASATDILLKQIKCAYVDPSYVIGKDDLLSVIYRYAICVRDNAGRTNLLLLAQSFRGMLERKKLYAEDFDKYANAISSLTRDELIVLARLHFFKLKMKNQREKDPEAFKYWGEFISDQVPSRFGSESYVQALLCAIQRSGLVMSGNSSDGGEYGTTPLMDEVYELTDFQEALKKFDRK